MHLYQKLITVVTAIAILSGCSTAYKSEPEKTVYFLEITEAGRDVRQIAIRSGQYDSGIGGGIVSIGSSMGFSPSTVLVAAIFGGLAGNSSSLPPDEVLIATATSNEGTFRGGKSGRIKFNPEMLLWVKGDALREYVTDNGQFTLQLADQDLAKKRRDLLNSSLKNKQVSN